MSNGELCCAAGVCCPPAAAKQRLAALLVSELSLEEGDAREVADWLHDSFDFVPKGNGVGALVAYVATHVAGASH